ncbi:MAG: DUF4345 family protein [Gammaproteobacteria bacterium]|nr:DUF4345 family protein [Gammaproteobacteria bacterium]MDD9963768.1 DUF4345 family protein [Gammaproteobacteria bacterium]MDE0270259.1 DUF4345 family protein [Gammaproteobacteria bacterium]
MNKALQIIIGILAALTLVQALWMAFDPQMTESAMGIEATNGNLLGLSSLRADVAGLFLGMGVMLALGLWQRNSTWFLAVALLMGTIAFGRLVGFVADGVTGMAVTSFVIEIVVIGLMWLAHRQLSEGAAAAEGAD